MTSRRWVGHGTAWLAAWLAACIVACDEQPTGAPGVVVVYGRTGLGPGEFSYPRAAAFSVTQRVYVVDKAARIQGFATSGEYACGWRMPEWSAGKPTGIGCGPDGRVYLADTHYARVMVFEPDGRPVAQFGSRGTGPGQFVMPTDVAVDAQGFVYVGDYGGNDRISKFAPDGTYLLSFGRPGGGDGELQRPQSLVVAADGTLWVADACNHRICHFSAAGEFLGTFGRSGAAVGELRFPYGLTLLPDDTLVVCEYGNNRLQRFRMSGESLGVWGTAGRGPGQLAYPWDVVAGPNEHLFVVDSGNNRVQVIDARTPGLWRTP